MKKSLKYCALLLILLLTCFSFNLGVKAENGSASKTYTIDSNQNLIPTQDAYLAMKTIKTLSMDNSEIKTLSTPEDMYYQENLQKFYIADTGNHRILVLDKDLKNGISIGEDILKKPQGVFTNEKGDIYVCDYTLKKVVIFNSLGEVIQEIGSPNHPMYAESASENGFLPTKICVDQAGTMYIIDSGNGNGIVTITKDGGFAGYFGANYVKPSFSYMMKFLFATKEQRKKLYVSPVSPRNLAIDDDGLINTISSIKGSAVKKLNIAGTNLFPSNMVDWTTYVDICVGPTGTIYCIEETGFIAEYDQEGNLLFDFGGQDKSGTYVGLFASPKSIEVDTNNSLYVLDGNSIQIFIQTEFASLVHQALTLYNNGLYAQSREPWEQVLKMNNLFDLAHRGLGNAYLREMKYTKAMEEFKLAKATASYSDAFWEVRSAWIKTYGYGIILGLVAIALILFVLNKFKCLEFVKKWHHALWDKLYKVKLIKEICYIKNFIKHPLNGFYEIQHKHTMSVLSATILYLVYFIIIILSTYFTGFVFNPVDKATISVLKTMALYLVPFLLFVIANYLISSITNGSGKLKDVYIGTVCSLAPVILFYPFLILFSNVIVESESFLYTMPKTVLWGWSFILMFFMIKDIEDLQVGETIKNIILTGLTMILFVAFFFLLYILGDELVTFVRDIFKEVISRV